VKNLVDLDAENYDAVLFPGGFGVAKNFSNLAFEENENF